MIVIMWQYARLIGLKMKNFSRHVKRKEITNILFQ